MTYTEVKNRINLIESITVRLIKKHAPPEEIYKAREGIDNLYEILRKKEEQELKGKPVTYGLDDSPCLGCKDHKLGCRPGCKRYERYEKNNEINRQRRAEALEKQRKSYVAHTKTQWKFMSESRRKTKRGLGK